MCEREGGRNGEKMSNWKGSFPLPRCERDSNLMRDNLIGRRKLLKRAFAMQGDEKHRKGCSKVYFRKGKFIVINVNVEVLFIKTSPTDVLKDNRLN